MWRGGCWMGTTLFIMGRRQPAGLLRRSQTSGAYNLFVHRHTVDDRTSICCGRIRAASTFLYSHLTPSPSPATHLIHSHVCACVFSIETGSRFHTISSYSTDTLWAHIFSGYPYCLKCVHGGFNYAYFSRLFHESILREYLPVNTQDVQEICVKFAKSQKKNNMTTLPIKHINTHFILETRNRCAVF
jgi:hypothetical protein